MQVVVSHYAGDVSRLTIIIIIMIIIIMIMIIITNNDSFQYKNGCLAASDHMFTQSIKLYTFHYHVLRVQMFQKCDSSNRQ